MRRQCVIASWTLSMGLILLPAAAAPQPAATGVTVEKIPAEIVGTPSQVTTAQRQVIAQYIKQLIDQMQSLNDEQMDQLAKLRELLVEPLRQSQAGAFFRTAYGDELTARLTQAMKGQNDLIRLNQVIVADRLGRQAADLMAQALSDDSPAVRYWSAKSIGQMGRTNLPQASEGKLLQTLGQTAQAETSPIVLQQLLAAMGELASPAANQQLLATLTQRLTASPTGAPLIELAAIQDLFRKSAALDRVDLDLIVQAAGVMYRYLETAVPSYQRLIAQADKASDKASGEALRQQAQGFAQIIDTADAWLPWSQRKLLGEAAESPAKMRQAIDAKQDDQLTARLKQWQAIMQKPPFNLK